MEIKKNKLLIDRLFKEIKKQIIGQHDLVKKLLIAIFCNGHVLIEGVPGLAKTTVLKSMAQLMKLNFQRIQFTPDLLPADIIGTEIYQPGNMKFAIKKGPIFNNIILADEINRASAKVQSALLEAMQERQVTLAGETFLLKEPFMVMATQNPIEQDGTYLLPEAQLDRFMFSVWLDYPKFEDELTIVKNTTSTLEVDPQNSEAYLIMGKAYGKLKMYEKMNDAFTKSLEISNKYADEIKNERMTYWYKLYNEGVNAFQQDKIDEATTKFSSAVKIMPENLKSLYRQRKYWALGNIEELYKKNNLKKLFAYYYLAVLDIIILILSFLSGNFIPLALFFAFESLTMITANRKEKGNCNFESLIFPFFMYFLAFFYLIVYISAFIEFLKAEK